MKLSLDAQPSKIAILDFGSQYTQVIARKVRALQVYSQVYSHKTTAEALKADGVKGIILSGGPCSVFSPHAPMPDPKIFELGLPILGICYGLQLLGHLLGGKVASSDQREYGQGQLNIFDECRLLIGVHSGSKIWNSHGDKLLGLPLGFHTVASTENTPHAVIADEHRRFYGMQFHPEVAHTEEGLVMLKNFLVDICGIESNWQMGQFATTQIQQIRDTVGQGKVILGLSGGVDSAVAAALIHKAIGKQLTCVFVDNGLLRANEREWVTETFGKSFPEMDLRVVDAQDLFLNALAGVSDPETKRKTIGKIFIDCFEEAVKGMGPVEFLAQGTLYPDVIESVAIGDNPASLIKSHHNVGGLPERMSLKLLEPLRELFKDEVRELGKTLGVPEDFLKRHPFPGPGLAVRVIGEITREKLDVLRKADQIFIEELRAAGWYDRVWQAFVVHLPIQTVGVMGDERTYDHVAALRAIESSDGMTADWAPLPIELLKKASTRITNEVKGFSRVVYDVTSKPPATIEWE
jgi:GMP synthase (glutamine-hydrolysing)